MGTSNSNEGPQRGTPLLPSWAPSPEPFPPPDDKKDPKKKGPPVAPLTIPRQTGDWGRARADLSRYANDGRQGSLRQATRSYVRASGGAGGARASAIAGRSTVSRFGSFLSSAVTRGVQRTLHDLGLDAVVGEPLEIVFAAIADKIAPSGALNEEAIARKAVLDTMADLLDELSGSKQAIEQLESLDKKSVEGLITKCVSAYVFERWLHELGLVLEKKVISETKILKLESSIKSFIESAVKCDFQKFDILHSDLMSGAGRRLIDRIFEEAYSALESV